MSEPEILVKNNIITVPTSPISELQGLGRTYFDKMKEFKNEIMQTDGETGEEHTYELVLKKSIRAAIAMRSKGIKPKDVITICSDNHMDVLVPYYASFFLGAVSANLDPLLSLYHSVHLLRLVRPKMIFVQSNAMQYIEESLKKAKLDSLIVVFGDSSNHVCFSEFLLPSQEEASFTPHEVQDLKETAIVVFTSGTTGMPKGACLNHYGILGSLSVLNAAPLGTRFLAYTNLYWASSVMLAHLLILHGWNKVIYHRFDVNTVWNLLEKRKVHFAMLNPPQVIEMCANGRPEGVDTSNLQLLILGGAPLCKETILHIKKCLPDTVVRLSYGLTEQNGNVLTTQDMLQAELKPDSVGRPRKGYSYKVVDIETEEVLGPNKPGELRIKTDFVMNGYYGINSSDLWDSDGYMKTGDILYYDEDFCFFLVGRIKDIMKYQMWHISPVTVENVVYTHPAVKECVVSSRTHEKDGDHLLAVVILHSNCIGKVTEKELECFVNENVENQFKLRAGVKFVKSIPLTVTGKPNRILLKDLIVKGEL